MTKRAKIWWLVGILVVAVAGGGGAVIASRSSSPPPDSVAKKGERPPLEFAQSDVVRLQPKRLAVELTVPGSVLAVSQATVRAKLSAEVKRVLVREGDRCRGWTAGRRIRYGAAAGAACRADSDARVGACATCHDRADAAGQRPTGQAELHFAERVRHG